MALQKAKILIIDDDEGVVRTLIQIVRGLGFESDYALTLTEGMEKVHALDTDIVLLDVNLPDGSGLDVIKEIAGLPDAPQVIILTAFSDPDGAELAIENGAWDYIRKPASPKTIKLQMARALEYREQKQKAQPLPPLKPHHIIGSSRAIQDCLKKVAKVAQTDAHVLLTGETGTGKELFAKAIHENSSRSKGSFIVVDCSILSENLIESVLFGHEKGAFTGAERKRSGLALLADRGTLFLDEVGELPESIQGSFLRMLQEKKFRPVGSEEEVYSDFRVISATNKNIEQMAAEKKFRSDLLFRLKSFSLELPSLRSRKTDIDEIAFHYMQVFCRRQKTEEKELSEDFLDVLRKYDWPGNVRELANTMETCIASSPSEKILFSYHLPSKIRARVTRAEFAKDHPKPPIISAAADPNAPFPLFRDAMAEAEKNYLLSLFSRTNGDIEAMCRISGISRAALYRKLKSHSL